MPASSTRRSRSAGSLSSAGDTTAPMGVLVVGGTRGRVNVRSFRLSIEHPAVAVDAVEPVCHDFVVEEDCRKYGQAQHLSRHAISPSARVNRIASVSAWGGRNGGRPRGVMMQQRFAFDPVR
jgi:hypothetical protein